MLFLKSGRQFLDCFFSLQHSLITVIFIIFLFQTFILNLLFSLKHKQCEKIQHTVITKGNRRTSQNQYKNPGNSEQHPHIQHLRNAEQ